MAGRTVIRAGIAAAAAAAIASACAPVVSVGSDGAPGDGRCRRAPADAPLVVEHSTVFAPGVGYAVFRIPAAVTTPDGVVIAFAEARPGIDDPGSGLIDVVMRRSLDCGRTWGPQAIVADAGIGDAHNPTAVVAPGPDGTPTMFLFWNERPDHPGGEFDIAPGVATSWFRTSTDDGATWSEPRRIDGFADPAWRVTSFGPGRAIVTRYGTPAAPPGRIVVPGWYTRDGVGEGSFVIWSDDGGRSWERGDLPAPGTNEAQLVELTDGTLVLDTRGGPAGRSEFRSTDGGATWSAPTPGLAMTPVMSGVLRHSAVRDGDASDRLLHSGVARDGRHDVRVWTSSDEGATWDDETVLQPGIAQYSLLTPLDDGSVGLVYETVALYTDPLSVGLGIRFARFDPKRLGGD